MIFPIKVDADFPRLVFAHDVDDRDIAPRGYRGDATVEFASGEVFPLYFYEPTAVREELDGRTKWEFGRFVAEPGLVIIPEISVANMKSVVAQLIDIGYFAHYKPITESAANKALNPTGSKSAS